mmetsp:Transcript_4166/g.5827  ORF Transcript_4166/g.5827 Transcript_4166/m.5827 type:complete len:231 (+) Transcript_4166:641-1333(+)
MSLDISVTLTDALGSGDPSGRQYDAPMICSVTDCMAQSVTSFSSHVPALFHTLTSESAGLASTSMRVGSDDDDAAPLPSLLISILWGVMSPMRRFSSSVCSWWKKLVFLPFTILYPRTWSEEPNSPESFTFTDDESFASPLADDVDFGGRDDEDFVDMGNFSFSTGAELEFASSFFSSASFCLLSSSSLSFTNCFWAFTNSFWIALLSPNARAKVYASIASWVFLRAMHD